MVKHKKTFEELEILPVNKWQDGSAKLTQLKIKYQVELKALNMKSKNMS
jgi:hypothetical protein